MIAKDCDNRKMYSGFGYTDEDLAFAAAIAARPSVNGSQHEWLDDVESTAEWAHFIRLPGGALASSERDPNMVMLRELQEMSEAAARARKRLVAYMRERSQSSYTLRDLAEVTNMSISGVRTLYGPDDLRQIDSDTAKARQRIAERHEVNEEQHHRAMESPLGRIITNRMQAQEEGHDG